MSDEEIQRLILEIKSVRKDLQSINLAVLGDPEMGLDGMRQHIDAIRKDVEELKKDVHGLKNDRVKIIAWVSGIAAGCSVAGTKLIEYFKS